MLLEGKNVFLTGGSRGIGKAAIMELVKNGANVAFTYVSSEEGAKDTVAKAKEINPNAKLLEIAKHYVEKAIAKGILSSDRLELLETKPRVVLNEMTVYEKSLREAYLRDSLGEGDYPHTTKQTVVRPEPRSGHRR